MKPTRIHPKVAGAGVYGTAAIVVLHLLARWMTVPAWAYDYLPLIFAIVGGYLTPTLRKRGIIVTTQAELDAFAAAEVPPELEASVYDELRRTGGDSGNAGDVATALQTVTAPPAEEPAADTPTPAPAADTPTPAPAADTLTPAPAADTLTPLDQVKLACMDAVAAIERIVASVHDIVSGKGDA